MMDNGYERKAKYTYCTKSTELVEAIHKNKKSIRDVPEVMYLRPDGTSDSETTTTLPTLNALGNAISVATSAKYLGELPNYKPSHDKEKPLFVDIKYGVGGKPIPNDQYVTLGIGNIFGQNTITQWK